MLLLRKFPGAKNSMDNKGGIKFFHRKLFVLQCRKVSQGNPSKLCFRKCPVAKNIMYKMGGNIKIFRRSFWSHNAENFRN